MKTSSVIVFLFTISSLCLTVGCTQETKAELGSEYSVSNIIELTSIAQSTLPALSDLIGQAQPDPNSTLGQATMVFNVSPSELYYLLTTSSNSTTLNLYGTISHTTETDTDIELEFGQSVDTPFVYTETNSNDQTQLTFNRQLIITINDDVYTLEYLNVSFPLRSILNFDSYQGVVILRKDDSVYTFNFNNQTIVATKNGDSTTYSFN